MGVEFNLQVIEHDGEKLFELMDDGVRVLFNKLSAKMVEEINHTVTVQSPGGEISAGLRVVKDGASRRFLCLDADGTAHAQAFGENKETDSLYADWYDAGSVFDSMLAQSVPGHNFSASKLIVTAYRGQEMAKNRNENAKNLGAYYDNLDRINTVTKAAVQPSAQPPVLLFD